MMNIENEAQLPGSPHSSSQPYPPPTQEKVLLGTDTSTSILIKPQSEFLLAAIGVSVLFHLQTATVYLDNCRLSSCADTVNRKN